MELQYAPPAKSPARVIRVIAAGLASTAATLVGVYVLDVWGGENIMGWHADYVFPIGAIVVGLAASAGYGVASWITGLKIRKTLLWTILLLQVGAYFGAQYVTFASRGPLILRGTSHQVTFPEYFHLNATHFAWKNQNGKGYGKPLGGAGYFFIGLEILGFALGGLMIPGAMMLSPYCELCQMYMKTRMLGTIPASVAARKVPRNDTAAREAYQAEQQQAIAAGKARVDHFMQLAAAGDAATLRENLDMLRPSIKAAEKLPARVRVILTACPCCQNGNLTARLLTGHGKQQRSEQLQKLDVTYEFVQQLTDPRPLVSQPDSPAPRIAA